MIRETVFSKSGTSASDFPEIRKDALREFGARLDRTMTLAGGKKAVAERTGTSLSALYRYANGEASPSVVLTAEIAEMGEVDLHWLLTGAGTMEGDSDPESGKFFPVPRIELEAAAGDGRVVDRPEVMEELAFRADWLRSKFGDPSKLEVLTVRGDSQEPLLHDGQIIMIHRGLTAIDEGLFVVSIDDMLLIKRLQLTRPGQLQLKSANESYDPIVIDLKADADAFRIIGKVVWTARTLI
ncbi:MULTISPECIES: XRE family transcriptional regulator [Pacificimonas]|nr:MULTISPECIES: XRE family transcriptional regulator [Pacificimonas]MBZ6377370.1 helix-turn-helix transcriptional regulator [Pacificimonas aurantium]